jgi:hypothetical protein
MAKAVFPEEKYVELGITVFNPGFFGILKSKVKLIEKICKKSNKSHAKLKCSIIFEQHKKDNFFKSYNISKKRGLKKKHKFCVRKLLEPVRPRRISRNKNC